MRMIFYYNVVLRKRQFVIFFPAGRPRNLQDGQRKVEGRACEVGNIQTEKKEKKNQFCMFIPEWWLKNGIRWRGIITLSYSTSFIYGELRPPPPPPSCFDIACVVNMESVSLFQRQHLKLSLKRMSSGGKWLLCGGGGGGASPMITWICSKMRCFFSARHE